MRIFSVLADLFVGLFAPECMEDRIAEVESCYGPQPLSLRERLDLLEGVREPLPYVFSPA